MFFLCRNRLESNTEHWNALLLSLRELIEWVIRKDTELTGLGPVCGDVAALQKQQVSRRLTYRLFKFRFALNFSLYKSARVCEYFPQRIRYLRETGMLHLASSVCGNLELRDSSQVTRIWLIYLKSISYSRPLRGLRVSASETDWTYRMQFRISSCSSECSTDDVRHDSSTRLVIYVFSSRLSLPLCRACCFHVNCSLNASFKFTDYFPIN